MEAMREAEKEAVRQALDRQMRKETFEHALGKAMRRQGLSYEIYVMVMSEIRELARKKKIDTEDAARRLIASEGGE